MRTCVSLPATRVDLSPPRLPLPTPRNGKRGGDERDMSREARPGTAIVVAHDSMDAARVEAALRGLAGWQIDVCTPRQVRGLFDERPEAIVVVVLPEAQARRLLRAIRA